jgi:hypothetical protein
MRIRTMGVGLLAIGMAIAAQPAAVAQQQDAKAAGILASTRKAIGKKVDGLTSLGLQAAVQRNVGNFQMNNDVELLVEMPDKYMRSETSSGGMVNMASTLGFNGDRPLKAAAQPAMAPGGGMIIRMGGPGGATIGSGEKPTPEQQQEMRRVAMRSARQEISRLMLGWFAMAHPSVNAQYTYAGEAESPDGKAYVIDVKNADGFAARLFIDEKTQLPLMLTYQGPQARIVTAGGPRAGGGAMAQPGQGRLTDDERKKLADDAQKQMQEMQRQAPALIEYALYFEDWRDVDGIKFPHALRRAAAGATTEAWTISKVRVNPKIDPKKFETEN